MAEPTAQLLARQRLAATDLTKFAPPPPKRKKDYPEPPKYTTQAVKTGAEERKARKLESHQKWIANHPGYYTKEAKLKRKEKRENGKGI